MTNVNRLMSRPVILYVTYDYIVSIRLLLNSPEIWCVANHFTNFSISTAKVSIVFYRLQTRTDYPSKAHKKYLPIIHLFVTLQFKLLKRYYDHTSRKVYFVIFMCQKP